MLKGLWSRARNNSLDRLSPAQCIAAYGTLVQSTRRNLLVVTTKKTDEPALAGNNILPELPWINTTDLYMISNVKAADGLKHYRWNDPLRWMCSSLPWKTDTECVNRLGEIKTGPGEWVVSTGCSGSREFCDQYRWPVDYCLSEPAEPMCQLHFSPLVAIIVTILNFCKCCFRTKADVCVDPFLPCIYFRHLLRASPNFSIMGSFCLGKAALILYILHSIKEDPLMNMGDAVASFLENEDTTSDGLGLLSIHDCKKGPRIGKIVWQNPHWRWKDATSKKRRTVTLLLYDIRTHHPYILLTQVKICNSLGHRCRTTYIWSPEH